jgi:D-3-phosphoglycerate dehydrogenase
MTKDRLTRTGRWNERNDHMGQGLTGKVLGLIGAGSIGLETMRLARAFGMRMLAADPYGDAKAVSEAGGELVELDDVFTRSDFVVVACLLNASTRHLVNAERLAKMKRSAYLINVARGPIVDEVALTQALGDGTIAGAALDVFEQEPVDPASPLLGMEQVIVTPHALCWTDECFDAIARSGLGAIADVAARRVPEFVVDRDAVRHERAATWFQGT